MLFKSWENGVLHNAFESLWVSRCYSFPLFPNIKTTLNPLNNFWIFKFASPDEL